MIPLVECMEDNEKEKLNQAFEKDFQHLNNLLLDNGFPTCEAFGKTSFDAFAPNKERDEDDTEKESKELSFKSSPTLKVGYDGEHFAPTKSPKRVGIKRNVLDRKRNYKSFSKILI